MLSSFSLRSVESHVSSDDLVEPGVDGATRPRGRGELVLIVDDEDGMRDSIRLNLESHGYRTIGAHNGAEAVTIYAERTSEIAVVLTDMMMPIMGGLGTIRALRAINPHVHVVAMSGVEAGVNAAKGADGEVPHFIPKPYTAENLLQTLSRVLRGE
jgi:two-component system cell cycle sensor histidine kinase/response regulator CckA